MPQRRQERPQQGLSDRCFMHWIQSELSHLRVLIVNPYPEIRTIMRGFLGDIGIYDTYTADNSVRALNLIPEVRPDIAILDKQIGPVNGVSLTRYLRCDPNSPRPDLPIVFMGMFYGELQLFEARDAGVSEVVAMPFSGNALQSHVKAARHQRPIIATGKYVGPDRRRREVNFYFAERRRAWKNGKPKPVPTTKIETTDALDQFATLDQMAVMSQAGKKSSATAIDPVSEGKSIEQALLEKASAALGTSGLIAAA
jgi:two-component system chemotaxis response regulator CheY